LREESDELFDKSNKLRLRMRNIFDEDKMKQKIAELKDR
jgi:hypothetical protein